MIAPYYQDESATIYHADCLEVLPHLTGSLLLTDIPYAEVNRAGRNLRSLNKGTADAATFSLSAFVSAALGSAKSFYVFCGIDQISPLRGLFKDAGYSTRLGIWSKTNPSPMNGDRIWTSGLEACVFARCEGAVFNEHCVSPVWTGPTDQENWGHETPKPRWLFERLIRASTNPTDTVIDPCMGRGTTLRSAKDSGRRAIGIDINEQHCEVTAKRLSQEVLDLGGAA